jgi:hypothetical protein
MAGKELFHLIALSPIFISTGLLLRHLSWRKGILTIAEDRILIKGKKELYLREDYISRLKHLKKEAVQIRTIHYTVQIKFLKQQQMEYVCNFLEEKNNGITLHNIIKTNFLSTL